MLNLFHEVVSNSLTHTENLLRGKPNDVKLILKELFPNMSHGGFMGNPDRWRKELRICSPEIFDVYFRLSISPTSVSRQEMLRVINNEQSSNFLARLLEVTSIKDLNKCRQILERIPDYIEQITEERAVSIINTLLEVGDRIIDLGQKKEKPFEFRTPIRFAMSNLILELLKKVREQIRYVTLEAMLQSAKSPILALYVFLDAGQRQGMYGSDRQLPDEFKILKPDDVIRLQPIAIEKIQIVAKSVDSFNSLNLRTALRLWAFIDSTAAKQWVQINIADPIHLLDFVQGFMSWVGAWDVSDSLFLYFDRLSLCERIARLVEGDSLDEVHLETAKALLETVKC